MSRLTAEGAPAANITPLQELERTVLACMLWEDIAYEAGEAVGTRIQRLVAACPPADVANLAVKARNEQHLRHVPLLLTRELARRSAPDRLVQDTLYEIIQRPDEITEFMALYWKDGKSPVSKQVKAGLAGAFTKFGEYELAKYNRTDKAIKLRDVMFMVHPKPKNFAQTQLWRRLINNELTTPDTWETALSSGADKKATWERLLGAEKLGALAMVRNLRNMLEAGVNPKLISDCLTKHRGMQQLLPFRFIAAAKHAPIFKDELSALLLNSVRTDVRFRGTTVIVVDVSGSMRQRLSAKSDMTRLNAAAALAAMLREQCHNPIIFVTAGSSEHRTSVLNADCAGLYLATEIEDTINTMGGGGIFLKQAMDYIASTNLTDVERVIVITDEQDCGRRGHDEPSKALLLGKRNYMLNVGSNENGVGYGNWVNITGFSEHVIHYMHKLENGK